VSPSVAAATAAATWLKPQPLGQTVSVEAARADPPVAVAAAVAVRSPARSSRFVLKVLTFVRLLCV
jgi:hypothetical protein